MCWTSVPEYQRADIPKLNEDVIGQVTDNFNSSFGYEQEKQPDLSALRFDVPKQVKADLDLGGQLRSDTQDQMVGSALNQASNSGVVDSFSGRGLVAKDIGGTAETLRASRLDRAQNYMKGEPLEYLGLTGGQIASVYTDDKVREFQNQKDIVQAQQADTATNIAVGLGVAQIIAGLI